MAKPLQRRQAAQKAKFLEGLIEFGAVTLAARHAGIARQTAYSWANDDEQFAAEWEDALDACIDEVESSLYMQAKDPDGPPVAKFFYLKNRRRETWNDRYEVDHGLNDEIESLVEKLAGGGEDGIAGPAEGGTAIEGGATPDASLGSAD